MFEFHWIVTFYSLIPTAFPGIYLFVTTVIFIKMHSPNDCVQFGNRRHAHLVNVLLAMTIENRITIVNGTSVENCEIIPWSYQSWVQVGFFSVQSSSKSAFLISSQVTSQCIICKLLCKYKFCILFKVNSQVLVLIFNSLIK